MGIPVTEAVLEELLHGFESSAFRFEAQPAYAVTGEDEALGEFAEGRPRAPREFGWWRDWLDLVAGHTSAGKTMERVRILAEPPTTYQRWLLWSDRWHTEAGERISCLPRSHAVQAGLPLADDWWLFDGTLVTVMRFTPAGEPHGLQLITDPSKVRPYCQWRDVALRQAEEQSAAA